ncbi:MAG: CDGSH iron-sulfur domain-containing protein, partial [Burkholderiales bacterium]|nr:CDGSH iron-sulfur domain-containing protein [Burkholderiales bacterium]
MDKPLAAGRAPIPVALEAGREYYWCTCGKSQRQPFCDGSHKGSALAPLAFSAPAAGEKYLCACKATATPPY